MLGQPFVLYTDHMPLQWLSAQKMEGRLCQWALALQEFDFEIKYRRGSTNTNADALSRIPPNLCAVTQVCPELAVEDVRRAQQSDKTLQCCLNHCRRLLSTRVVTSSVLDIKEYKLLEIGELNCGKVHGPVVRVLFHNLISPISIYTRRAFWARLSMLHVMEFNL